MHEINVILSTPAHTPNSDRRSGGNILYGILGLVDPIHRRVPLAPRVTASDCSVPLAGAVAPPVASETSFLVITIAIMYSQRWVASPTTGSAWVPRDR